MGRIQAAKTRPASTAAQAVNTLKGFLFIILLLKIFHDILGTSKNRLFFSMPLQFLPLRGEKHAFLSGKHLKLKFLDVPFCKRFENADNL
jgi:hypothetical protein